MPKSPWSELRTKLSARSSRRRFVVSAPFAVVVAASCFAGGCQAPPVAASSADGADAEFVGTTTLRIEILTPNDAGKQMKIAVVQSRDGWLKATGWAAARSVSVTPPLTIVEFEGLPARPTAISVFIDVDENDDLGRGAFGIPSEPYGFSNNATVLFGPPRFDDAAIELVLPSTTTSIKIRKLSSRSEGSVPDENCGQIQIAMSDKTHAEGGR